MTDLTAIPAGDVRDITSVADEDYALVSQEGTTAKAPMTALKSYMGDEILGPAAVASASAAASAAAASSSAALAASRADDIPAFAGFRDRADVATLLADTTFTYTSGLDGTVVAGEVIRTRNEGFAYRVAASGATDHDVATAGGVKLYVEGAGGQAGNVVMAEQFGAVGDYVNDADPGADDSDAIDAALLWVSRHGGGKVVLSARYRVTSPVVFPTTGIAIEGSYPEFRDGSTTSVFSRSAIIADFATGPAILIGVGECRVKDIIIEATAARTAAALTTGAQNINCAILCEPPDTPGASIKNIQIEGVVAKDQPGGGILSEGSVTNLEMNDCHTIGCGWHGKAITSGALSGRTNKSRPGITFIIRGQSIDNKGHGVLIGHPSEGGNNPYRHYELSHESYRNALDASRRLYESGCVYLGQDITLVLSASAGTVASNVPTHLAFTLGGRDISLIGCRYIGCQTNYVSIVQLSGLSTESVTLNGGTAVTVGGSAIPHFATMAAGVMGITMQGIGHDCTNPITSMSLATTNYDVRLSDLDGNKTVWANHTLEFPSTTVTGPAALATVTLDASGILALPGLRPIGGQRVIKVDTFGSAATDNMEGVSGTFAAGDILVLMQANSARRVTVLDNSGDLRLSSNFDFGAAGTPTLNTLTLIYDGTRWMELSRSLN